MPSPKPLFDFDAIEELKACSPDMLTRILTRYFTEIPRNLDRLSAAADANDFFELQAIAHSLKSSTAQLGMANVANAFATIEQAAKAKQAQNTAKLISEIKALLSNAEPHLREALRAA